MEVLGIILSLGPIPNWDKSELVPVKSFISLGARFESRGSFPRQNRQMLDVVS